MRDLVAEFGRLTCRPKPHCEIGPFWNPCCQSAAVCVFGEPGAAVTLRPPGQPALKVRLSEPTVVAVATRPEKWGFFQFPTLARWTDGTVAASWGMRRIRLSAMEANASGDAISKDGVKTGPG